MTERGLELADLVDLELQLLRDGDASRDELRRRDRRIGLAIGAGERLASGDVAARRAVLGDWVHAVTREAGGESAGDRLMRGYHAAGWLLALLGLTSGMGSAAAVLAYDGTRPVNAVHFLAVFVALQLVLLAFFLLSSTLWRLRARLPGASGLYGLVRLVLDGVTGLLERRLSAERRSAIEAARGRLRASVTTYGDLEHWLLVSLGQRFGLSFNLGALATCLYLVAFSDLAFAWQTTLSYSAESFHRLITILGAPWSWFYPDGVPTLDVVRASRYYRIGSSFGEAPLSPVAQAQLLGQWWRFLVLSLLVYGLLPRAALSLLSRVKLRRSLGALRLDHADVASLLERLVSPVVHTRSPTAEPAPPGLETPPRPAAVASAGQVAAVIVWGGVPIDAAGVDALLAARFGWRAGAVESAGADDTRQDAAAVERVAGGDPHAPVVVLAESFEAPTREARAFLQQLRAALGATRPIVVGLVDAGDAGRWTGPTASDLEIWHKHVAALGDPYLRVEPMVEDEA